MTPEHVDAEDKARAESRNPLTPEELPYAKWLGSTVRSLRLDARFTAAEFAERAQVSRQHLWRLEVGLRHTRASTLERFASVLVPRLGENPEELAAMLIRVAGPALAAEPKPEHMANIARHRRDRKRRRARKAEQRAFYTAILRELGKKPRDPPSLRGPDGRWLPPKPTPEQLEALADRYHVLGLVVPPIDEEGCFVRDSPLLMRHVNAMRFQAARVRTL